MPVEFSEALYIPGVILFFRVPEGNSKSIHRGLVSSPVRSSLFLKASTLSHF